VAAAAPPAPAASTIAPRWTPWWGRKTGQPSRRAHSPGRRRADRADGFGIGRIGVSRRRRGMGRFKSREGGGLHRPGRQMLPAPQGAYLLNNGLPVRRKPGATWHSHRRWDHRANGLRGDGGDHRWAEGLRKPDLSLLLAPEGGRLRRQASHTNRCGACVDLCASGLAEGAGCAGPCSPTRSGQCCNRASEA